MNTVDITNRVAQSDIEVYNLENLWDGREVAEFDLAPFLHRGLVLRERSFREQVKQSDWTAYAGRHVAVYCSAEAIVPTWAFMVVATKLDGIAASVTLGEQADLLREYFVRALEAEDWSRFEGKPVVIKGCGGRLVPESAYLTAVRKLQGVASKLMYGEPCSAVPLWRKRVSSKKERGEAAAVSVKAASLPTSSS